jgi:hypothetical protein
MNKQAFFEKRAEYRALYFPKQKPVKTLGLRPEMRRLRKEVKKLKKKFNSSFNSTVVVNRERKNYNAERLNLVAIAHEQRQIANQRYVDKYGEA